MFVVLDNNYPASSSNALALSLRNRILEAAVESRDVSIGWQQGRKTTDSLTSHCLNHNVKYYIGIELAQELDGRYTAKLRALDLADRTWLAGFGKRWRGSLSTIQRQAMRQQQVDDTFTGTRDVPFTLTQTDLLAASLARQLSCTLQQHSEDEYVVGIEQAPGASTALSDAVELIANNLANRQTFALTSDASRTNAVLSGKAHQIDGPLYQYWLTVTPRSSTEELTTLSASAYIVLPDAPSPSTMATVVRTASSQGQTRTTISIPNAGEDALLSRLRLSRPASPNECRAPCSLLQSETHADAIVFVLQYQPGSGLVRLTNGACRQRTSAKLLHRGEELLFTVSGEVSNTRTTQETFEWELQPAVETFYVVAMTDADLARQMANHIDNLPLRCTASKRAGLSGQALHDWLTEFALRAARSSGSIDWRAVQVQEIT